MRCFIGVAVVAVVIEDIKEAAEEFIAPPVTINNNNINANEIVDDANVSFMGSQ